jgi:ribosome-associated protein
VISITPSLEINESEITLDFIRASGPGGQNVNKVATAVQLRFNMLKSTSLPPDAKDRLVKIAGHRITSEGVLLIEAKRYRTQEQNRADAVLRLVNLIQKALEPPRPRHQTRPTLASRTDRILSKKMRGKLKQDRRNPGNWE